MHTRIILALAVLLFSLSTVTVASNEIVSGESLLLAQARFKEFEPLPGEQVIQGELLKVEKQAYVVKDANGTEHQVKVNEQTILRANFKPGEKVQAHVNKDGVASVIKHLAALSQNPQEPQTQPAPLPHQADKGGELLPGHRIVTGTVEDVKGDMARVRFGELETRPLALKQGTEKGEAALKQGDRVEMIINSENGVVDYHRQGEPSRHQILRGRVAEVAEGVESALIVKENGAKERYVVQPEARSRIKRVFDGAPALFLVGEANNILDAVAENSPEVQLPVGNSEKLTSPKTERVPKQ